MDIEMQENTISQQCAVENTAKVCTLIRSKYTSMYPVKRGSLDSVHVFGSQQLEKIGIGVETIKKVE